MSKEIIYVVSAISDGRYVSYEKNSFNEWETTAYPGEKLMAFSLFRDTLRKVLGKTLTIVDASVHDKEQNKAVKDLVRGVISDETGFASELIFDQDELIKRADSQVEIGEPITIDEALGA